MNSSSYLSLRQSYAAALIRLVNGLVDPLQLGVYARSIAAIAAQLGLPAWLVDLRHAATHEDLPSLELLRQASREVSTISCVRRVFTRIIVFDMAAQQLLPPDTEPVDIYGTSTKNSSSPFTIAKTLQNTRKSNDARCIAAHSV